MRALVCLLLALAVVPVHAAAPLTIFAAASLKETMDEAGALYSRMYGVRVRTAYAASSALARQVEDGAPADVFIAADDDWMDTLQRAGRIDARSRRDVAGNSLVLVAPSSSRTPHMPLRAGVDLRPALGRDGRIALAFTSSVPAGKYGRESLQSLRMWTAVAPRVVQTENVRAALQLVARGEAALGVVYASDARADSRVRVVGRFPSTSHARIVYPAARIATSRHPHAAAFTRWLRTPAAQAIFRRHGFSAP